MPAVLLKIAIAIGTPRMFMTIRHSTPNLLRAKGLGFIPVPMKIFFMFLSVARVPFGKD